MIAFTCPFWSKGIFQSIFVTACIVASGPLRSQGSHSTENIILITIDGLRWEEVFGGAVDSLVFDSDYVKDTAELSSLFLRNSQEERRRLLLPFFWNTLANEGQLYGNRWKGNEAFVTNAFWFSYPGYNELLTGQSDPNINSNSKIPNPNVTILEMLNITPEYRGSVAAFGSWDVFRYIINEERSKVHVNAGFSIAESKDLTEREAFLNELQPQIPSPWATVRLDAFTHHYAMEYIRKNHPKVIYIAYGETDDFAHDGRYDHYLKSAHQTSEWIEELWDFIQSDPFYMDKTTMVITTDHGRGHSPKNKWTGHGRTYAGSNAIWMGWIGPDTEPKGEITGSSKVFLSQIAPTIAHLLNFRFGPNEETSAILSGVIDD